VAGHEAPESGLIPSQAIDELRHARLLPQERHERSGTVVAFVSFMDTIGS
jgi:hypothetical protein